MKLDLENYESIRSVTDDLITTEKYIDFVVNNAGTVLNNIEAIIQLLCLRCNVSWWFN